MKRQSERALRGGFAAALWASAGDRARALPLALLLIAGCRHAPVAGVAAVRHEPSPIPVDRGSRATTKSVPGIVRDSPPAAGSGIVLGPAAKSGEAFEDLFERMRVGFGLPQVEDETIDRRIEWYVQHSGYLDRAFRRGRRYLHYIVAELESRSMPRELALLPVIESAFDPFAYSPCSASGLWQIIPSTGRLFGLRRSWWYDGRRDVIEATRAALDYLQVLHGEFGGDWLLAVAAYNAGARNVQRAVERNQRRGRPTDFFHLDLPLETHTYVPAVLALARLVGEPKAYGLDLPAIPNEPYFSPVEIEHQVDLGVLADRAGIPREELIALNPAFNRWATAPDGPHRVLVPVATEAAFASALAALPAERRLRFAHHRVRAGDTLWALARRYGISIDALRRANRLEGHLIRRGQDLVIPLSYGAVPARLQDATTLEVSGSQRLTAPGWARPREPLGTRDRAG